MVFTCGKCWRIVGNGVGGGRIFGFGGTGLLRKALLGLVVISLGVVWGQPGAAPPPNPLGSLPAPLVGALMDLYVNYQQNRPRLAGTPEQESLRAERARMRDVKVASGVAIGSAIGALVVNNPRDRAKAAAIGAVAGALTTLLVDHVQARNEMRRAERDGYAGGESEPGAVQEPVPVPR